MSTSKWLIVLLAAVPALGLAADDAPAAAHAEDKARLCGRAYRAEDQAYLLANCPEEAWALARAQCERSADTVSPRYAEFCQLFHSGRAPSYGY